MRVVPEMDEGLRLQHVHLLFSPPMFVAGYAIPVRASFEFGAIDDDFDAALLSASLQGPSSPLGAAQVHCWPDDFVLLGGSLAAGDGPGALLVPRAHPAVVAALGAEAEAASKAAAFGKRPFSARATRDESASGERGLVTVISSPESSTICFSHGVTLLSVSKHAPLAVFKTDKLRRDAIRGIPSVGLVSESSDDPATQAAMQQPRAAARISHVLSQQPRFAQPGTLEFDFACEWRKLQVWFHCARGTMLSNHQAFTIIIMACL